MGRNAEAIAELKKAEMLDPLSLIIRADLAEFLVIAHSYDESILESRKAIEMDSNFALAHNQLGQAYLQKHMYDEAIAELRIAVHRQSCPRLRRNWQEKRSGEVAERSEGALEPERFPCIGDRHDLRRPR